jgi:hypothetical protein
MGWKSQKKLTKGRRKGMLTYGAPERVYKVCSKSIGPLVGKNTIIYLDV